MHESSRRMNNIKNYVIIFTFFILGFNIFLGLPSNNENRNLGAIMIDSSAPHSKIVINGNSGFTSANGVSNESAAGTIGDPYILENWEINGGGTGSCIEIHDTDMYFIIQYCILTNAETGILLENVTNGIIFNNSISSMTGAAGLTNTTYTANGGDGSNGIGIQMVDSTGNLIEDNVISNIAGGHGGDNGGEGTAGDGGWGIGIYFISSSSNDLINNSIQSIFGGDAGTTSYSPDSGGAGGLGVGICFSDSINNILDNNTMGNIVKGDGSTGGSWSGDGADGASFGIYLANSSFQNEIFQNNTLDGGSILYLYDKHDLVIQDYTSTSYTGATNLGEIALIDCTNITVIDNIVAHSRGGGGYSGSWIYPSAENGGNGEMATGIYLLNTNDSKIINNTVYNITGGQGGVGGYLGAGGYGAIGAGIYLENSLNNIIEMNNISQVEGGHGGNGGYGSAGRAGGIGSGVHITSSSGNMLYNNTIQDILGGYGGSGGYIVYGGNGNIGAGIYLTASTDNYFWNQSVSNITGGDGGKGGYNDNGGDGGFAGGIYLTSSNNNSLNFTLISLITGGDGGPAGTGGIDGAGGSASGVYVKDSSNISSSFDINVISGGSGSAVGSNEIIYFTGSRNNNSYAYQIDNLVEYDENKTIFFGFDNYASINSTLLYHRNEGENWTVVNVTGSQEYNISYQLYQTPVHEWYFWFNDSGSGELQTAIISFLCNMPPIANFSANTTQIIAGQSVQFYFTGQYGKPPTSFHWDFGDNSTNSTLENPIHTYNSSGNYSVNLTITDDNSNQDDEIKVGYIEVLEDLTPFANFTGNETQIVAGQSIQFNFTGQYGNTPTSFHWDFGDSSTNSTLENPVHTYTIAGNYSVNLTITDDDSDQDEEFKYHYIEVLADLTPNASFTVNTTDIVENQQVQFNFNGQYGNTPTSFHWDFGDGTTIDGVENPIHTYNSSGNFTVNLTITDRDGDVDLSSQIDLVDVVLDIAPNASFTRNPAQIIAGQSVQFNFTGNYGNAPPMFLWEFGDNSTNSTLENPIHTYNSAGTYTVKLTITDHDGDVNDTIWVDCIEVVEDLTPVSDFQANVTKILVGERVDFNFTGFPGNTPSNFSWDFGDGGTNDTQNTSYVFTTAGYWSITLTVTDADGDSDTHTEFSMIAVLIPFQDDDQDGLTNEEELKQYNTNPLMKDTDGDGYSDNDEISAGTDPLDSDDHPEDDSFWNNLLTAGIVIPVVGGVASTVVSVLIRKWVKKREEKGEKKKKDDDDIRIISD